LAALLAAPIEASIAFTAVIVITVVAAFTAIVVAIAALTIIVVVAVFTVIVAIMMAFDAGRTRLDPEQPVTRCEEERSRHEYGPNSGRCDPGVLRTESTE
jgi:hypothetical protein